MPHAYPPVALEIGIAPAGPEGAQTPQTDVQYIPLLSV
jgi:hypothetical protein